MTSAALIALTVGLLPMSPVQAPTPSSWTAIERLKPGTEIVITLRGSTATTRYVALVDSSGVDLLNVTMLPPRAGRSIVDTARDYPLFVRDARRGGVSAGSVRLSPAGVFVESQKVAELEQVLTRVPEAEVYEVRIDRTPNWTAGRRTAVIVGAGLAIIGAAVLIHALRITGQEEEQYERELAAARAGGYPCHCGGPEDLSIQKTFGGLLLGGGSIVTAAGVAARPVRGPIYRAP